MQEMIFIFVIALILIGPKKLPELGRTLGKAMTEFRRVSSELRSNFDREMHALEQATEVEPAYTSEYYSDSSEITEHYTCPVVPEVDASLFVVALQGCADAQTPLSLRNAEGQEK